MLILSLKDRQDRRDALMAQLEPMLKQGVLDVARWQVWAATPHRDDLVPGSWQHFHGHYSAKKSHLEMMEWLWQQPDFQNALILEDDAELEPWFAKETPAFLAEIESNQPDWLALFLGGTNRRPPQRLSERISLSRGSTQCHAYIINRHGLWRLYDHLWSTAGNFIDWSFCDLMGNDACIYQPARWQVTTQASWSDNRQEPAFRGQ